ncbi:two-component system sensor histidine kinase CreC [Comamonas sp. Y33R10-2]|uniref:two-component system sensor histidine kinase CreC n=1 Tax=Comamonas sp. Y33R10-2 TaxID=2853257 RepID=UPI001C5CB099|nr:two-component system sensor histidine kinase CreC [Comamonas sp. Y33R10-2]QXZ09959.1 two-component system sensor histidine kinase CreC [Comamonas sp. Y33R10-2]
MHLGLRLFFAFFLINGLAAFFVLRVFMVEIKPSVRKVTEDTLVETAYALAALASADMASMSKGQFQPDKPEQAGFFATQLANYTQKPIQAWIWDARKTTLDMRITVTDTKGMVLFDSQGKDQGADYSRWRDVYLTLRGEYGARTTRAAKEDESSSVMYVSAPIIVGGKISGVLTASKPSSSVQKIVDSAEQKILRGGLLFVLLSAGVGCAVTWWFVMHVRRLRNYAQQVQAPTLNESSHPAQLPEPVAVPNMPGELGELAQAMDTMRKRLEGRDYIEGYVRALTHELKSPVAAIRGAGELLQEDLPAQDRAMFAKQVVDQSLRLQNLIDQLLQLSRLEQRQQLDKTHSCSLMECAQQAINALHYSALQRRIQLQLKGADSRGPWEAGLVTLAISNLLQNALDFSPQDRVIAFELGPQRITISDQGPGVPDAMLGRLGERFFTTPRPNGERSGTGLGLSIVARIMHLHGGSMSVHKLQPGLAVTLDFAPKS